MRESALVTGITGQDGSYLAEFLLSKGYEVHGVVRRTSTENLERIEHLEGKIQLHEADLLDAGSLLRAIRDSSPREIYNLAAQSFVPTSWSETGPNDRDHGRWSGPNFRRHSSGRPFHSFLPGQFQ